MPVLANCTICSKSYRVPHKDKDWHCKVCREVLVFADEPEAAPKSTECSSCGALFFGEESFCEECGEDLTQTVASKKEDTRLAGAEMRRATKRVARLKSWITYNLVMSVLTSIAVAAIVMIGDLDPGMNLVLILVQSLSLGLAIFSRVFYERRPFPIVVSLAALQTLFAILALVAGERWIPIAAWAAGLWLLSLDAAQVTRLARQYPDLYLSRRMRGEHLTSKDGSPSESRAQRRIREDARRASKKLWIRIGVASATVFIALVSFAAYKISTAPPSPEAAIARFQKAWNAEDLNSVIAEATDSHEASLGRSLQKMVKRYEWGDQLPHLDSSGWKERGPGKARAKYEGEAGVLVILLEFEQGRWGFIAIDARDVKTWRPGE